MISNKIKNLVRIRLSIMKYMLCCLLYWDRRQEKFLQAPPYIFFTWCYCYYSGIAGLPLLFGVMYLNIQELQGVYDSNEEDDSITRIYKSLAISFNVLITGAIIFCSLIVSILKQMRVEVCVYYNAIFQLDSVLKDDFKAGNENGEELLQAAMNTKTAKFCEASLVVTTFYTIGFPFVMFLFMFHPTDPVHRILVDIMDIPVTPTSPVALAVAFVYGWSCFAMCSTFITFIYIVNLTLTSSCLWVMALKPVSRTGAGDSEFETEMMGQMDCHKMIRIYSLKMEAHVNPDELPEQEDTFELSDIIIKTEEVDLDEEEILSLDQQFGVGLDEDFIGTIEPVLNTPPEDIEPMNFDAWDANDWAEEEEDGTPNAIPEIETIFLVERCSSSSEDEVASFVSGTGRFKQLGRIQSDDVEMAIVVNEEFPEDKLLQCIACPFLVPVPKGPPDVFFEKALAILEMKKHFQQNHENEIQWLDSSPKSQPTWMDVRKQRKKESAFSSGLEKRNSRKGVGRPPDTRTKKKDEDNLSAKEVGNVLENFCLNEEGYALADRIKMRGRRK
ncbi:unnamed protein product [Orchesella dallaii]|uniref:Uncharacterized protein n=1 Tax=Orchesella dallaii TaxID=48710 RepID=A0ABP1RMD1_9HEXA